jgi:hypothetical protein
VSAAVIVQHLGHQSPLELVLTLVVGIAPFLVLGVVVAVARSRDLEDEEPRTAR